MSSKYVESFPELVSHSFNPGPLHRLHTPLFNGNFTPKYLYRLIATQPAGTITSNTFVTPAAGSLGYIQQDIFHLPAPKAANLILNHLLWQRGHEDGCSLMSWTSSLLFALQYALYRHQKDGDDLRHIYLILVDTRSFPAGTFIQDLEIMRAFAAADRRLQKFVEFRESEYYFGEYLTQGRLNIQSRCVFTSVQKMIDLGLFELQPGLRDETQWRWWPKTVLDLRELFSSGIYIPTTDGNVETAVSIAQQCFGEDWTVPGALMLLALQPRKRNDRTLVEGFKARFTVAEIRSLALHEVKIDPRRLPEVAQFGELVQLIQHSYALSDYEAVVVEVLRLSV